MDWRIIVISLRHSVARRQAATAQLNRHKLAFEFLDGVEGANFASASIAAVDGARFLLNTGRHPTPGEIGCYASHRQAWMGCAESGKPTLVLEDDFLLGERIETALQSLAPVVEQLGLVRLAIERRGSSRVVSKLGDFKLVRYTRPPMGAMAYVLSPSAARSLVAGSEIIGSPVDTYLKRSWRHRVAMYGLQPYPVQESDACPDSSIGCRKKARKNLAQRVQRLAWRARCALEQGRFNLRHRSMRGDD